MERQMPNENENAQPTVDSILANPSAHGFSWYEDKVAKDNTDLGLVPLVRHENVDLLRATFGDKFFLDSADGTSRHVTNQRIGRDMRWSDRKGATVDAIKRAIVENMLGMKAKRGGRVTIVKEIVEKPVFIGLDGKSYETLVEMQAASMAWMIDQQQNAQASS
jgi:hypothetical protein